MQTDSFKRPRGPIDFSNLHYNQYYSAPEEELNLTSLPQTETKYKFELGGLLVYDSKATMLHSSDDLYHPVPSDSQNRSPFAKDPAKSTHSDYSAFLRMKHHTPDPPYLGEYALQVPADGITLSFNSKFESANLHKAVKISDYEYMLYLNSDTNTCDQNHWYYFSVVNPRKTSITFKITNMLKKDLLYLSGMKPCVYSTSGFTKNGVQWHRDGYNISYIENNDIRGFRFIGSKKYYTLSFSYDFKYENDLVFFAYAVPYTHTQLTLYLNDISTRHPGFVRVDPLCKTLGGNTCQMVTITHSIKDYFPYEEEAAEWSVSSNSRKLTKLKAIKQQAQEKKTGKFKPSKHQHKKAVVLTARVHSGETVSSFMMLGAIDFLISPSQTAKVLRRNFVFKIVPMLNPDGCRYGNYRCSLLGIDLNRRWNQPNKALHPTVYYCKKMIEAVSEKHELALVCDMHGHTKKRNVFMYGCSVRSFEPSIVRRNVLARVVPYLMGLRNKFFSFKDSHFRMEDDRKATARVVLWESFNISHCYTMEASFYGPDKLSAFGKNRSDNFHMSEKDLGSVGAELCKLCLIFTNTQVYMKKVQMTNEYLRHMMMLKGLQLAKNLKKGDKNDEEIQVLEKKTKEIHKENKREEQSYLVQVQPSDTSQDIETEWQNIEVAQVEPDSDSGGSDSNCSFDRSENISTTHTEINPKPDSRPLIQKKSKTDYPKNSTPEPCSIKKVYKKFKENTYSNHSSVSPKNLASKKDSTDTPIIPQVFMFPEDKLEYFPIVKHKIHLHEPEIKIKKKRVRMESMPIPEIGSKVKIEEEMLKNSIEKEKVIGKYFGSKILNDFFNVNKRINAHSVAASTRFKIEKNFLNK